MEIAPPQLIKTLPGHVGGTTSVSISPDGLTLVSGGYDSMFRVWDTSTGQEKHALPGNRRGHVAFWPHQNTLLAGGLWGDTKLYDIANWQVTEILARFGGLWWLAFSSDGNTLATVHADEPVILLDTSTWRERGRIETESQCSSVAFTPNGDAVVMALSPTRIIAIERATGRQIATVDAHQPRVFCIAVSPDGSHAASGGADNNAILWDTSSWTVKANFAHRASVISVTFSPDNRYLVTGTLDGTISFWQIEGDNG